MSTEPLTYDETFVATDRSGVHGDPLKRQVLPQAPGSFGRRFGSIVAGAVLGSIVVCIIANLADIRRYIRISTM